MRYAFVALAALVLLAPASALAVGGHDGLSCTGCHSIHDAKGSLIFAVLPNKNAVNPRTKEPFSGITALCLGCHETTGGMGILPVQGAKSHPYGIKPNTKVAAVPEVSLRDGKLECIGCHDPHPANPNYRYLRVDTQKGAKMQNFCSLCHSSKSGIKIPAEKVFSSMDERAPH